jgi:Flp pilus assembly protein TadG
MRKSRKESGQSLVEFALVLPILLLLVFGIVEFGRIWHASLVVNHAAREGARQGIVADTNRLDTIVLVATNAGKSLGLTEDNVDVTSVPVVASLDDLNRESSITVKVRYDYRPSIPIIIKFLKLEDVYDGNGVFLYKALPVYGTAIMMVE